MKKHYLYRTLLVSTFIGASALSWSLSTPFSVANATTLGSSQWLNSEVSALEAQSSNIDPKVLRLSLIAYIKTHKEGLAKKPILTVIDYSKPDTEKRLWVFDLSKNKTLYNTWVSHGKNSGGVNSTSFSNQPGSLKSSIGVFVTEQTYEGKNGYSLRLKGLERGVNDNAERRAVVIHGAPYVSGDNAKYNGRIGRSWGCPAVSKSLSTPLINAIKGDTVMVAYYPDKKWLSSSAFLSA